MEQKKQLIAVLIVTLFVLAPVFYYMVDARMTPPEEKPLSETPIISVEARERYASGFISRAAAERMIEDHLSVLKDSGNIERWSEESSGDYLVVLNDGTLFSYVLN